MSLLELYSKPSLLVPYTPRVYQGENQQAPVVTTQPEAKQPQAAQSARLSRHGYAESLNGAAAHMHNSQPGNASILRG